MRKVLPLLRYALQKTMLQMPLLLMVEKKVEKKVMLSDGREESWLKKR